MRTLVLLLLVACSGRTAPAEAPPPAASLPDATPHAHAVEEHAAMHGDDATVAHRFADVDRWVKVFDDPARDAWQKPASVVEILDLKPGMRVADIGAGTGYFNPWLAAAVGEDGKVVAVDIESTLVEHMRERAEAEGTPQVEARLGEPSDPKLKPAEVDRVMLVDVYHHIDDRVAYFQGVREAVAPNGRLVVVDFKPEETPHGPPVAHRIASEKVVEEMTAAGWHLESRVDSLPEQYILVFER